MLKYNRGNRVVTLGELLIRFSSPSHQRLFQTKEFNATFCGSEANVAVSLACFGANSKFVSVFPDNEIGKAAIRELNYFGLDVNDIYLSGKRMGTYYYENGASQRPSKVIYDREYSAFALSKAESYNWDSIFLGATWFHFSGINPALSNEARNLSIIACKEAKKRDLIVSCDLNFRSTLWTKKEAQESIKELMPFVDVCIGNEEDAENFFGIKADKTNIEEGVLNKDSYESVAKQISKQYGCKYVALSLRSSISASENKWAGILYDSFEESSFFSKEYLINIVDRVGSGDSFSAGIIYSILNKYDSQSNIDFAAAASCLKHTIEGDFNRITLEDVHVLLKTKGSGRVIR